MMTRLLVIPALLNAATVQAVTCFDSGYNSGSEDCPNGGEKRDDDDGHQCSEMDPDDESKCALLQCCRIRCNDESLDIDCKDGQLSNGFPTGDGNATETTCCSLTCAQAESEATCDEGDILRDEDDEHTCAMYKLEAAEYVWTDNCAEATQCCKEDKSCATHFDGECESPLVLTGECEEEGGSLVCSAEICCGFNEPAACGALVGALEDCLEFETCPASGCGDALEAYSAGGCEHSFIVDLWLFQCFDADNVIAQIGNFVECPEDADKDTRVGEGEGWMIATKAGECRWTDGSFTQFACETGDDGTYTGSVLARGDCDEACDECDTEEVLAFDTCGSRNITIDVDGEGVALTVHYKYLGASACPVGGSGGCGGGGCGCGCGCGGCGCGGCGCGDCGGNDTFNAAATAGVTLVAALASLVA